MSRVIRVAGVQHNRVIGDIAGNLERILAGGGRS